MYDSTTVTVGLDVHARLIRLAAVRADELLEARTLAYDEVAVERVLRRWPAVPCCYEAGPTGFGLQRFLAGRGSSARWWRRAWFRRAGARIREPLMPQRSVLQPSLARPQ